MKKVRRWAVFGPTPGSFASSSISAVTDAAVVCMSRPSAHYSGTGGCLAKSPLLEAHAWRQAHSAGDGTHHLLLRVGRLGEGVLARREDEILQQRDVLGVHDLWRELDAG